MTRTLRRVLVGLRYRSRTGAAALWVELVAMVAAGVLVAIVLPSFGPVAGGLVGLVAAGYTVQVLVLPSYERLHSLQPIRDGTATGVVALLAVVLVGLAGTYQVRAAGVVMIAGLATALAVRTVRVRRRTSRRVLVVGDRVAISHLVSQWARLSEVTIAGVCLAETPDDGTPGAQSIMDVAVVGGLADVPDVARQLGVDQIVVAPGPVLTAYDVRRMSWAMESSDIEVAVAAEMHGVIPRRVVPRLLGRRLLLSVRPTRPSMPLTVTKWVIDRVGAAVLLVLFAPVLAGLWAAVRLDSPGPGFFRQRRAGQGGATFTMYKLRTMMVGASRQQAELAERNEGAGPLFKLRNDPRVTRIGHFLRATSLDELPQLLNVVKGEMSLIGPRPALPTETIEYDDWIRRRLTVKPGMTGLWQVSGRSRLGWNEAVRLDLDYVDNVTIAGEMAIAARTLGAVARRDGAC